VLFAGYFPQAVAPVSLWMAVSGAAMLSRERRSALTPRINSAMAAPIMSTAAMPNPISRLDLLPVPMSWPKMMGPVIPPKPWLLRRTALWP
jgi:hypothetical protein